MFRIVIAIVVSLVVHAILLASLGFRQAETPRPETILVKLVDPPILTEPEPAIVEIPELAEPEITPVRGIPVIEPEIVEETEPEFVEEAPIVEEAVDNGVDEALTPSDDSQNSTGDSSENDNPTPAAPTEEPPSENGSGDNTDVPDEPEIDLDAIRSDYSSRCLSAINSRKSYPSVARRLGQEGNVGVRVTLSIDGTVINISVSSSSGTDSLDDAAVNAVRSASPLPSIPDELDLESITLTLTIIFILD